MALGGVPVDAVEGLDGELQGAFLRRLRGEGQGELAGHHGTELLHRALAEGRLVPDDDGAAVVLQGRGENLGSRGAGLVHEDDERSAVDGLAVAGILLIAVSTPVERLDDGALADEETGHVDGLLERAAAVVAQVDDESVDALDGEAGEEAAHVGRRARLAAVHVGVEGRKGDPAQLLLGAGGILRDDEVGRGETVLQVDLVAHDVDQLDLAGLALGNDLEADDRADLAADEVDDVGELHFDDVDEFTVRALGHPDDAVAHLELAHLEGRTADDETLDRGPALVLVLLQHRADSGEGLVHPDAEVVVLLLGEVFAVRIVGRGDRLDEERGDVLGRVLLDPLEDGVVAVRDLLVDGFLRVRVVLVDLRFLAGLLRLFRGLGLLLLDRLGDELLAEQVALDQVAPELVVLLARLGPLGILPRDLDGAVGIEGEGFRDGEFLGQLDPVAEALLVDGEDFEGGLDVPLPHAIVDVRAVFRVESVDVLLGEIDPAVVEHLEIGIEGELGHLVVERLAEEMLLLQHSDHAQGEVAILRFVLGAERGGQEGGAESRDEQDRGRVELRWGHKGGESESFVSG